MKYLALFNESFNSFRYSSRDHTIPQVKDYMERNFGFSSIDIQDWIQDILDKYLIDFKVRMEKSDTFIDDISIDLFYPDHSVNITEKSHPISDDEIEFLKNRLKDYGFNLNVKEYRNTTKSIYYSPREKYLTFKFRKFKR